jgi:DnaK suppressor protein
MKIAENKKRLEEEKKVLESELASMGRIDTTTGEWVAEPESQTSPEADENDLADRSEGYEERSGTTEVLNQRLGDIEKALENIENNTYGICQICGKKIEEDRLEANPAALTCKSCMEKV